MAGAPGRPVDPERDRLIKEHYLKLLRTGSSKRVAAGLANTSRPTIAKWRKEDPDFKAAEDEAFCQGLNLLEDAAVQRAVHGVKEHLFHNGRPIYVWDEDVGDMVHAYKVNYSDRLLQTMLRARNPDNYDSQFRAANIERKRRAAERASGSGALPDPAKVVALLEALADLKASQ